MQGRAVTSMVWNTLNSDLLAVGYGKVDTFVDSYKLGGISAFLLILFFFFTSYFIFSFFFFLYFFFHCHFFSSSSSFAASSFSTIWISPSSTSSTSFLASSYFYSSSCSSTSPSSSSPASSSCRSSSTTASSSSFSPSFYSVYPPSLILLFFFVLLNTTTFLIFNHTYIFMHEHVRTGELVDEQLQGGLVLFWSLRNPEHPEKIMRTPHPVNRLINNGKFSFSIFGMATLFVWQISTIYFCTWFHGF